MKTWKVYLAGEIHSDWRKEIKEKAKNENLPVEFSEPVTNHDASDHGGVRIFGEEDKPFWQDHKGAKLNAIRTRTVLKDADIVIVKFGEKYKQWNAAFDAGIASALDKAMIVIHPPEHTHALKEIDAAALAVAETHDQVVEALKYVMTQE